MPIVVHADTRRLSQAEFGAVAYQVMERVFRIHNAMGRFLDESIYQAAVAAGLNDRQAGRHRAVRAACTPAS